MRGGKQKTTMKRWILKIIVIGFIVIAVSVLAVPWYMGAKMRDEAREANEKLAAVYLEFLDSSIEGVNKLLSQFASSTYDISVLAMSENEMERYTAKQNVMQKLEDASMIYNVFDGIFVYSRSEIEDAFLCQVGPGGHGRQVNEMKEIMAAFEQEYSLNSWELVRYKDKDYLMRVVKTGTTSCGAWIDAASLTNPFRSIDYEETGMALFIDREGAVLNGLVGDNIGDSHIFEANDGHIIRLEKEKYLQISKPSRFLPISMVLLISEAEYLGDIYFVQNVVGLIMTVSLFIFPVLWWLLTKNISIPVSRFIQSMSDVRKGNLEVRIEPGSRFHEFNEMGKYFNSMLSEIQRLQKDVYERQISEQKIELQYLQTQIRPHFFLNTLNVIYSFSLIKRNDLIEKMVVCLSKYFSYRFKSTDSFVSLGEEKEHIENYLELHRLRYQDKFLCHLEIEDVLLDAKLPPLIIQTFAENSLKYGVSKEKVFELEIVAEVLNIDEEQKLKITVTDNGPGYEQEVIDEAARRGRINCGRGQGIGINNVIQRLKLIYRGAAEVKLSNMEGGGACSEIIIPLEFAEEEVTEGI